MNNIHASLVAHHPKGGEVWEFLLRNRQGTEAVISNFGAIIKNFRVPTTAGNYEDIVLGFDRMEDYWSEAYLANYAAIGCVVGRVANRIRNGKFSLEGKEVQVAVNLGTHHLHGGFEGFGKKVWSVASYGETPCAHVVFRHTAADGEEGYPGELRSEIRFELNDDNELSYTITANTDRLTIVNFTHHGYFNLSGNDKDIKNHELQLAADAILQQDRDLLPTGQLTPVENTPFDFRVLRNLGEGLSQLKEYDSSFVLHGKEPQPAALLRHRGSGLEMLLFTTEPVVHVYTGNWQHELSGKAGKKYGAFCGICLETQKHPDAINVPGFPDTVLRPGQIYRQQTIYRVHYRPEPK